MRLLAYRMSASSRSVYRNTTVISLMSWRSDLSGGSAVATISNAKDSGMARKADPPQTPETRGPWATEAGFSLEENAAAPKKQIPARR